MPRPKLAADLNTVLTRYAWPGDVAAVKKRCVRALTQLDGYELHPQDILLPDYDAATVAVGEDAMEGSLDEITSRFERSVLTQLYRNYPSTRKLAKRLGVSRTAIASDSGIWPKPKEDARVSANMPGCRCNPIRHIHFLFSVQPELLRNPARW
ncbi:TyrR/PhhR family helix-turn-helix DNA-binding protein [Escherichia coli]